MDSLIREWFLWTAYGDNPAFQRVEHAYTSCDVDYIDCSEITN